MARTSLATVKRIAFGAAADVGRRIAVTGTGGRGTIRKELGLAPSCGANSIQINPAAVEE